MVSKCPASEFRGIVWTLSALSLDVVLISGLWPFYPPRNEAVWVESENAIRFSRYGSLLLLKRHL